MSDEQPARQLVYTVAEVAKLLHVGEPRVYQLVASGGIPAIKLGDRATVIPCEALERYLVDEAFRQQQERREPAHTEFAQTFAQLPVYRGRRTARVQRLLNEAGG